MKKKSKFALRLNLQTFAGATGAVRQQEIETRRGEIRQLLEGESEVDLEALETELRTLDTEWKAIEKRKAIASGITAGTIEPRTVETHVPGGVPDPAKEERKKKDERGKALKEQRAVTVGASNIVLPKHTATDIRPTFNQVSSLIDRVAQKPLKGGESFRQGYITGYGEGAETVEGADYTAAEPTFAYVDINKVKITAYAEESNETLKLPDADYDGQIVMGVSIASRKRITRQILIGNGNANNIAGIFSAAATAIDSATDMPLKAITETTLDEIIYSFGGDEDVEDVAVLVLNKKDLKGFATLRDADGERIYTVVNNGNTGTIDGVPFLINSVCKAVSDAATVAGEYSMAYGPLSNFMLTIFSDMDVQRSTDYKFKQGMIAHRAEIYVGGNVVSKNGFLRVKKA